MYKKQEKLNYFVILVTFIKRCIFNKVLKRECIIKDWNNRTVCFGIAYLNSPTSIILAKRKTVLGFNHMSTSEDDLDECHVSESEKANVCYIFVA